MDDIIALESAGLTHNEAVIYLSLLKEGPATRSGIASATKMYRTNVYDAVHGLQKKGLSSCIRKEQKIMVVPAHPSQLLLMVQERMEEIERIIPKLSLEKNLRNDIFEVGIFEGLRAAKNSLYQLLEYRSPIYAIGTPKEAADLAGHFLERFHQERIKKRIWMHHLYNSDAKARIVRLARLPYTKVKVIPEEKKSLIAVTVCEDVTLMKFWTKDAITIRIVSEKVAQSFLMIYQLLAEHKP